MTAVRGQLAGGPAEVARVARIEAVAAPVRVVDGWATVDLERAAEAFGIGAVGVTPGDATADVPDDPLLGARCRRIRYSGGGEFLLLEPTTEGRLAASLARYGEGWTARYLLAGSEAADRLRHAGWTLSREADGPLGRERLVAGPRWGPHVLVVSAFNDSEAAPPGSAATGYHPDA